MLKRCYGTSFYHYMGRNIHPSVSIVSSVCMIIQVECVLVHTVVHIHIGVLAAVSLCTRLY